MQPGRFIVLAVLLASIVAPAAARAAARFPPGCALGQYIVSDLGAVLADVAPGDDDAGGATEPVTSAPVVQVSERRAAIPGLCEPTRLRVARKGRRTRVKARWKRCASGVRRVRMKATMDTACETLRGTLKIAGRRKVLRFTAPKAIRVLVFSRTAGFRHASIEDAREVLGTLDPAERIVTSLTEDAGAFTDANLDGFDVVLFANTTGDVLDDAQQDALVRFIRAGKGYVGAHSAADTEHGWPWYGRLVGAYFRSHPLLPVEVVVTTEDRLHPSTAHLPPTFSFRDEIYNFDRNPRLDHAILLTIDEAGFVFPNFPAGPSMGDDHPIAWYKEFEGGRSFYTNLGHRRETWHDPLFRQHLLEGIRWAAAPVAYSRHVVTRQTQNPLALAVAPDGDVFYIERTGEVRVWSPATGRVIDAARLEVDTSAENGLLGIALDPGFGENRHIYLYHSTLVSDPPPAAGPPGRNVLSRYTVRRDDTIDTDSRVDLLEVPSERECCHEGGALAFGPDGTLFLSTGDNTDPFESDGTAPLDERPGRHRFNSQRTAQDRFDLRGKILRINPDGSIPAGNMFPPSGAQGRPEIYVMGCRNPFRTAVDPATGRLFWGEVGPDAIVDTARGPRGLDEINVADRPGNYGWPWCIGANFPYADWDFASEMGRGLFSCAGMVPAVLAYDYLTVSHLALGNARSSEEVAITGRTAIAGVFYRRPPGNAPYALPPPFADTLLMTEWTRDILAAVDVGPAGDLRAVTRLLPWERFRRPIDLEVGPDGALYVLEFGSEFFGDNDDAALSRIEYAADGGLPPVARIGALPVVGDVPLTVTFSAAESRALGRGDSLKRFRWDLDGDGTIDARTSRVTHTFKEAGVFPVTLVVTSRSGRRSVPAVEQIVVGNTPPVVTIERPADGDTVTHGDVIRLDGSAVDAQDGAAPCDALTWDIRLGHNAHSHPFRVLTGCSVAVEATFPQAHGDGLGQFLAIELAYTDGGGSGGAPPLTGRAGIRLNVRSAAAP
jgi:glucose/arabinose dehydrogenase